MIIARRRRSCLWRVTAFAGVFVWLAACSSVPRLPAADGAVSEAAGGSVYVIRRGWHVDIGMARADLRGPLAKVAAGLPDARFVLFGFGDRRYLLHGGNMVAALWPGAGLVLVTGIAGDPTNTFGKENVVRAVVSATQMSALQTFVLGTLERQGESIAPLAPGPYAGSTYFASVQRYSGLHTCNTWAAQALESAGLPVTSTGVALAWQLWHQLRKFPHSEPLAWQGSRPAQSAKPITASRPSGLPDGRDIRLLEPYAR